MPAISPELDQLSAALVGAALDMVDAGEAVPVMLAVDCSDELFSFSDDMPDGCYRAAREQVGKLGADCTRYALLYDGVVQEDEADAGRQALLFEFAERGMDCAWSGYVAYWREPDGTLAVADPQPAGAEEPLFSG